MSMTPAEKLCSRDWRLGNSKILLPVILGVGFLTWLPFLRMGLKAGRREWRLAALVYGVSGAIGTIFVGAFSDEVKETSTIGERIGTTILITTWIVGMVHAYFAQRQWLKWKAYAEPANKWYAEGPGAPTPPPGPTIDEVLTGAAPPAASPLPQPAVASEGAVDINRTSAADLTHIFGFPPPLAQQVVSERDRMGGYTEVEQLMTIGGVMPHLFAGIRNRVSVTASASSHPPPPTPPTAPTTSPPPGRPSSRGRRLDL